MKPRATAHLTAKLERKLLAYATVATAAGIGVVTVPAEGKVVYTPAHVLVGSGGLNSYNLDLNNDGVTDFVIDYSMTCDLACYHDLSAINKDGMRSDGVAEATRSHAALAFRQGAHIGPKKAFHPYPTPMVQVTTTSSGGSFLFGNWVNVKKRYLGLKFHANGKVHFGWARFNVRVEGANVTGTLTGYAYETIHDKPIIAGDEGAGASLGKLALGAAGKKQYP